MSTITRESRYLTRDQAAEYLNMPNRTFDRLVSRGMFPKLAVTSRTVRYDIHDLDEAMEPFRIVETDEVAQAHEVDDWGDWEDDE